MIRKLQHLLIVALAALTAAILAGTASLIGLDAESQDSNRDIQLVRGYYSALNEYLVDGQADVFTPLEARASNEPSGIGEQDVDPIIELAALRSTYPDLRYRIVDIAGVGDTVVASVETDAGTAMLPSWIEVEQPPQVAATPVYFRITNRLIAEQPGAGQHLASFVDLAAPGMGFLLQSPGRVTVAELHLVGSDNSQQILPLPGPGVYIVKEGSITVIGDGMAELVQLRTSQRTLLPYGVEMIADQGDAIVVPAGRTIVRVEGDHAATMLAAVLVPSGKRQERQFEREHNDSSRIASGLLDMLREAPTGVQPIWFGTVELLGSGSGELDAGAVSLCAGWLVVPPGATVSINPGAYETVLTPYEGASGVTISESAGGWLVSNNSPGSTIVFVTRSAEGGAT